MSARLRRIFDGAQRIGRLTLRIHLCGPAPLVKCAGIQCGQVIQQHLVMRTRNAGRCKHLVEEAANVILACDDCRSVTVVDASAAIDHALQLVADGLPTRQIGNTLSITERTVKFHVNSIFRKLGADNRAQAVALAAQRGLLQRQPPSRT